MEMVVGEPMEMMTEAIIEQIKAQLPSIVSDVFRHEIATLTETFASRDEVQAAIRLQHDKDEKLRQKETDALKSQLADAQRSLARLEGRLESVENNTTTNTANIDRLAGTVASLNTLVNNSVTSMENTVRQIQSAFETGIGVIRQNVQMVADRQNSQSANIGQVEKRVTAAEDSLDKANERTRAAETINEDLRHRMTDAIPPLNDAIFGGRGRVGLVTLVEAQSAQMQPILMYIEELKKRDELRRQAITMAKTTAVTVLKNWKVWAFVVMPFGTVGAAIIKFLEVIFGG